MVAVLLAGRAGTHAQALAVAFSVSSTFWRFRHLARPLTHHPHPDTQQAINVEDNQLKGIAKRIANLPNLRHV